MADIALFPGFARSYVYDLQKYNSKCLSRDFNPFYGDGMSAPQFASP